MAAVATESALAKDIPEPAHDEVIEEKIPDSNLTVKIDVPGTKSGLLVIITIINLESRGVILCILMLTPESV